MSHPRVLIFSPFQLSRRTASAETLANLFTGWPHENLGEIYSHPADNSDDAPTFCGAGFRFPVDVSLYKHSGLKRVKKTIRGASEFLTGQRESFACAVRLERLRAWSEDFRPDLIYAYPLLTPSVYWRLPRLLAARLDIPYVVHMMDDWAWRFLDSADEPCAWIRKPILRRSLRRLFQESAANLAISEEMSEAFKKRYGVAFTAFHSCVDPDRWPRREPGQTKPGGEEITLLYTGRIMPDKDLRGLIDIRDAVLRLREGGMAIRFVLYGPTLNADMRLFQTYLAHSSAVAHGGFLSRQRLRQAVCEADILALPINFDEDSLKYAQYSFQTKVPEYMASGTPTIAYGPRANASIAYAARHEWAYLVDRPGAENVEEAIRKLVANPSLGEELSARALELVRRHHDKRVVCERFQNLLRKTARPF